LDALNFPDAVESGPGSGGQAQERLEKEMNKALATMSVLALAVVLATPAAAQSITVNASVPFDFTAGNSSLPAGDYEVTTLGSTGVLEVRSESGASSALTMSIAGTDVGTPGQILLVFHRYGDRYFLSQVWDGKKVAGRTIPMSGSELEVSRRASIRQPESVTIMARL